MLPYTYIYRQYIQLLLSLPYHLFLEDHLHQVIFHDIEY
nr:MAG TPA: hypothetical protein [Caudoviricetes sp.]